MFSLLELESCIWAAAALCATREADVGQGEVLPHAQGLILSSDFQKHVVVTGYTWPWVWNGVACRGLGLNAVTMPSVSSKDAEEAPGEAGEAKCRSLLPSRLVLRRMQHALRNGETCFLSWTRNVAAKMEQISDCYALKFGVLDILSSVEPKSLVLTCAI